MERQLIHRAVVHWQARQYHVRMRFNLRLWTRNCLACQSKPSLSNFACLNFSVTAASQTLTRAGDGASGGGGVAVVHGRAGGGGAAGVGALIRRLLEEVVLQRVKGRDARLGIVVQHAQDQVLELQVVAGRVTLFSSSPPPWTSRLHPQDLVQSSRGRWFIFLEGQINTEEGKKMRRKCVA